MAQLRLLTSSKSLYSTFYRSCTQVWLSRNECRFFRSIIAEQAEAQSFSSHSQSVQSPCNARTVRSIHTYTSVRNVSSVSAEVGGSSINFSTGKYAKLASGSALVESGSTSVLVTAVSEYKAEPNASWLPLQVDYRERGSATNKIPQTFFRRELRASTKEVLASRFIDRSIRPLFPSGYFYNTQVICNMLAVDGNSDHEILSLNGAAAALMLSDIPWNGPIGAIRVGMSDGKFCINPSIRTHSVCDLNLIVACTRDRIVMVEGSAEEVPEETICEAVKLAFEEAQPLIESLSQLAQYRKAPTRQATLFLPSEHMLETVNSMCREKLMNILCTTSLTKSSRDEQLFSLLDETKEAVMTVHSESGERVGEAFWRTVKQCMQELILERGIRCDGRGVTDLRDIACEVDTFKPLHGTAVFRRGESQVLCTVTFDSPGSAAKADILQLLLGAQKSSSFMLHYEFPPFATNTVGAFMNHNRREAGHGALAEKALAPLIPKNFPFTIRLNSQVLDSNGSTSMATICGGSLALFDAGVPMPRPAAGVACGLMTRTDPVTGEIDKYQILTDLLGIEDANGNMDLKIGGTREGVTSLQVDVKGLLGIPLHIFEEALMQSKVARHQVLDIMDECLSAPREEIKKNRPVHTFLEVPPDKLGRLLGVGGRRLKSIAEDTGANFTILEDEKISVFAPSQEAIDEFQERVDSCLKEDDFEFEIGSVVDAKVVEIRDNGIMVELAPRVFTLLHISKISHGFVSHPSQVGLKVGERVNVKYLGKDFLGRHQISRKALLASEGKTAEKSDPEFQTGSVVDAKVVEIRDNGILVELAPRVFTLLHISKISHGFISHPSQIGSKVGDKLKVKYMGKDSAGKHQISRKALIDSSTENSAPDPTFVTGQVIEATVTAIRDYGVMVELAPGVTSLLHKKNLSSEYVSHPSQTGLSVGDRLNVKYLGRNSQNRHQISRKALLESKKSSNSNSNNSAPGVSCEVGEEIEVTVKEVKDFGVIVELAPGVLTLLHNRDLAHDFVCHPSQLGLGVGDRVGVKYLGKDLRGKHGVSRKALFEPVNPSKNTLQAPAERFEVGQVFEGTIKNILDFGAMVKLSPQVVVLVPNKNLAHEFVTHPSQVGLRTGDRVAVKYVGKDSSGRLEFSRKALMKPGDILQNPARFEAGQEIEVTVKAIRDYGVMVELAPGVISLLHRKNLAHEYVSHPSQVGLEVEDKLTVKYLGQDHLGRHEVSRKAVINPDTPTDRNIAPVFEVGREMEAVVKEVKDFGVIVELAPGAVTLLHNRDLAHDFVTHPSQVGLREGDKVDVKYLGKDANGRHKISRKEITSTVEAPCVKFERGQVIEATVMAIRDYGVMVELAPGVTSLLHKRNLAHEHVAHPSQIGLEVGDKVDVQYLGPNISRKSLIENNVPPLNLEVGKVMEGTVRETRVMVELAPGVVCAIDKNNLAQKFVPQSAESDLESGDRVNVKYLGRNSQGRHQFSRVGHSSGVSWHLVQSVGKSLQSFIPSALHRRIFSLLNSQTQASNSRKFEAGQEIEATVKEIEDRGVTVELAPGVTSLLHTRDIAHKHQTVGAPDLSFKRGDVITVKYVGADDDDDHSNSERHKISLKAYP